MQTFKESPLSQVPWKMTNVAHPAPFRHKGCAHEPEISFGSLKYQNACGPQENVTEDHPW